MKRSDLSSAQQSWIGPYLGIGVAWGASFLFLKYAIESFTSFGVAFLGCTLGALTLATISKIKKIQLPRERIIWLHLLVVALCINVVPNLLTTFAVEHTTTLIAGVFNGLTPLTSLFFLAVVFREEPISKNQIAGIGVGFIGVLTVLGVWKGLGSGTLLAILALVGAILLLGLSFPYTRRHIASRGLNPVSVATAQLILASVILFPTFLINGFNGHSITARAIFGIIEVGAFANGLAFVWYFKLISSVGSSIASTVTYVTPVVAVICSVLFLNEHVSWNQPIGGMIVLLGAAIGQGHLRLNLSAHSAG